MIITNQDIFFAQKVSFLFAHHGRALPGEETGGLYERDLKMIEGHGMRLIFL